MAAEKKEGIIGELKDKLLHKNEDVDDSDKSKKRDGCIEELEEIYENTKYINEEISKLR